MTSLPGPFADDLPPDVALTVCERFAQSLIATDDEDRRLGDRGSRITVRDKAIFAAMLAQIFAFDETKEYLESHTHGPIMEWLVRYPDTMETVVEQIVPVR